MKIAEPIRGWLEAALAFVYPPCCQLCGEERASEAEGYVGAACRRGPGAMRWVEPPYCARCGLPYEGAITARFECANCRDMQLEFSSARAAVVATELVLEVVHRYKYKGERWFEPYLAELLVRRAAAVVRAEGWDLIVPVPLHALKQREREFNQAERLAAHLSRAAGVPLNSRLLWRVKPTQTQTRLSRAERAGNVRGAFALRRGARLAGERVVLVDDVMTTGATTSACALALRRGGASDVCVWTVARGV